MRYNNPQELLAKAHSLAGFTLGELATQFEATVPAHLLRQKGWVGQFIEYLLGAESASLAQADFPEIGVELKTLPIDSQGRPLESTYVSVVPLINIQGVTWDNSVVKNKLMHVLWIPIVADKALPIEQRQIATPFLWQPSDHQVALLRKDFEDALDTIAMGNIEHIDARFGELLQIRPKAANSQSLTEAIGPEGHTILTLPRGFYLRPQFTRQIVKQQFN